MASTGLIVATVFAAIFGGALIWLFLYYMHRYIHQRCLELDHWFHTFIPRQHELPVHRDDKEQSRGRSKPRSRSSRRGERRERKEQDRRRRERESEERADSTKENRAWERSWQRGEDGGTPVLQTSEPIQNPWANYQQHASLGWQAQPNNIQLPYQPPIVQVQNKYPRLPQPAMMYQQQSQHRAPVMPEPPYRQYPKLRSKTKGSVSTMKSITERSEERPQAVAARPEMREVDYIHICDEYPPIVQGALRKTVRRPPPSSSSSSSGDSEATQEVPRASIPRGKPHYRDVSPL